MLSESLHDSSFFDWRYEEMRVVFWPGTPGRDRIIVLVSSPRLRTGVGLSLASSVVSDAVAQIIRVILVA